MDPALNGGLSGIDLMQLADPRTVPQDVNVDPEPGNGKGSPPEPSNHHGGRKLVRNFTPS